MIMAAAASNSSRMTPAESAANFRFRDMTFGG
jgi:hypothetical protein